MKRIPCFQSLCAPKGYTKFCIKCGKKLIEGSNMFVDIDASWEEGTRPHCLLCACKKDKKLKGE